MFSELKYSNAYSHYFVLGIIKKCKDSRVRWWLIDENIAGPITATCLEHCAVVIADGLMLDARGVFRWDGEIKGAYASLDKVYEGTVEQFKRALRRIMWAYGNIKEKKQVTDILDKHRPLVKIATPVGERVYSIERWSYKKGVIQIREVYMPNEPGLYVYTEGTSATTMPVGVFKQHYRSNVGWRVVKPDVKA